MIVVQIHRDGTMDETMIGEVNESGLQKLSKSQGEGHIRRLYEWIYGESVIACYGWYDGDAGFENKHELPPSGHSKFLEEDSSTILLFGDLFLCLSERTGGKTSQDFDISMCGEFYHKVLGGFDDCDSLDSEEDVTESSDLEFIADDSDEEEYGGGDYEDVEEIIGTGNETEDTGGSDEDDEDDEGDESEVEDGLNYSEVVLSVDECLYEEPDIEEEVGSNL
jgi:hypothetical protein